MVEQVDSRAVKVVKLRLNGIRRDCRNSRNVKSYCRDVFQEESVEFWQQKANAKC